MSSGGDNLVKLGGKGTVVKRGGGDSLLKLGGGAVKKDLVSVGVT